MARNPKQLLLEMGINVFAIDLLIDSYLRSRVSSYLYGIGKPLKFFVRTNRENCPEWAGVNIELSAVKVGETPQNYESVSVGRHYVTGTLMGQDECRQGVLIFEGRDHIVIQGMDGAYVCEKEYAIIPESNIYGETREFAISMGVIPDTKPVG